MCLIVVFVNGREFLDAKRKWYEILGWKKKSLELFINVQVANNWMNRDLITMKFRQKQLPSPLVSFLLTLLPSDMHESTV